MSVMYRIPDSLFERVSARMREHLATVAVEGIVLDMRTELGKFMGHDGMRRYGGPVNAEGTDQEIVSGQPFDIRPIVVPVYTISVATTEEELARALNADLDRWLASVARIHGSGTRIVFGRIPEAVASTDDAPEGPRFGWMAYARLEPSS